MNLDYVGDDPNFFNTITTQMAPPNFTGWGRQGWVCPKCGRVYAPDTVMCFYCNGNNHVMPTTTTTPSTKEWWRDYCTITSDKSLKQELPTIDTDTFRVHYDQLPYYTTITAWN